MPESPTTIRVTSLAGANCEVTFDGNAFTNWPPGAAGVITLRTTVGVHHFLVLCR